MQNLRATQYKVKSSINMKKYEEIKQRLCVMLEEQQLRLDRIAVNVKHSDEPLEKDFAEQATQHENDEVLDYLGNSAKTEIVLIKKAIARIDSGQYGICEVCDEPIKKERLEAVPYTTLCIKCASQAEH
jgi:DnaK suppressor protein